MLHPIIRPTFLCHPDFVKRIPVFLDILFFKPEIPTARFYEKEISNFLPIRIPLVIVPHTCLNVPYAYTSYQYKSPPISYS
jgi:hypothetical protein